jgi:small-conductance mechanosensitive channel
VSPRICACWLESESVATSRSGFNAEDFLDLLRSLSKAGALAEIAVLAGCLLVAYAIVRVLRGGRASESSIWFGRRIVDGVLFPVIALALAFGAKLILAGYVKPAVFRLAVPMLVSLVVIRLSVRVLTVTLPSTRWVRLAERSISWIAWVAVGLWVTGVLPLVLDAMDDVRWQVGNTRLTLRNVVEGTLTAGLVLVIALWISSAIERQLLRGTGGSLSIRKMAANIVRALLLFVGLLMALSAVGIDLTALSVLGGAVGVGLGFGLQKIAANYISGFVVLAERSLRIGDMVKVDGFEGRITDIRTRCTVIRALNGRESIVPNEMLITQRVENASLADRNVLLSTTVQVAYGTDVRAIQPQIEAAIRAVSRVLATPPPSVQLAEFATDGIALAVQFWVEDPENGQGNVRSDVNLALLDVLNGAGVAFAAPNRIISGGVRLLGSVSTGRPTADADALQDSSLPSPA